MRFNNVFVATRSLLILSIFLLFEKGAMAEECPNKYCSTIAKKVTRLCYRRIFRDSRVDRVYMVNPLNPDGDLCHCLCFRDFEESQFLSDGVTSNKE